MNIYNRKWRPTLLTLAILSGLAGCGDSSNTEAVQTPPPPAPVTFSFDVAVTNLTNNQPLSPIALIAHQQGNIWTLNESASIELELMAEGGDNSLLTAIDFAMSSVSGAAPVGPGASDLLSLTINDSIDGMFLSIATMLVNTNDAFSGINRFDISQFTVGQTQTMLTAAYDSGTESNSEALGTIPGPADGGEGMNVARDDVDFVSRHSGVVSADLGLTTSILDESHRFDNPVLKIVITRTE